MCYLVFLYVHPKQIMYEMFKKICYCDWYDEVLAACPTWNLSNWVCPCWHASPIRSHLHLVPWKVTCELIISRRYLWDCLMNYALWWCVFLGQCEPFPEGVWKTGPECVAAVSSRGPAGLVHASDTQVRLVSQKHSVAGLKTNATVTNGGAYTDWCTRWVPQIDVTSHKSVMGTSTTRLATTF